MARIKNTNRYPIKQNPSLDDFIIGTNAEAANLDTVNFKVTDIADLIVDIINEDDVLQLVDGIISGRIVPTNPPNGLSFVSTNIVYNLNNIRYEVPSQTISVNPISNLALKRIDTFVVTDAGSLVVIQGEEAINPLEQTLDYGTQLAVTTILIDSAGIGGAEQFVYNEDAGEPSEWTLSTVSASVSQINLAATTDPNLGTVHIEFNAAPIGSKVKMINNDYISLDQYSDFALYINNVSGANARWRAVPYKDDVLVGTPLTIRDGRYGFNELDSGYQFVSIPMEDFQLTDTFNEIRFQVLTTVGTVYMDNIRLVGGTPPSAAADTWVQLRDTENTLVGKEYMMPVVETSQATFGSIPTTRLRLRTLQGENTEATTVARLDRVTGVNHDVDNFNSASNFTIATDPAPVINGEARFLVKRASKPTVTGSLHEGGQEFVPNEEMYLVIWNKGTSIVHYFISKAINTIEYQDLQSVIDLGGTDLSGGGYAEASDTWSYMNIVLEYSLGAVFDWFAFDGVDNIYTNIYCDTNTLGFAGYNGLTFDEGYMEWFNGVWQHYHETGASGFRTTITFNDTVANTGLKYPAPTVASNYNLAVSVNGEQADTTGNVTLTTASINQSVTNFNANAANAEPVTPEFDVWQTSNSDGTGKILLPPEELGLTLTVRLLAGCTGLLGLQADGIEEVNGVNPFVLNNVYDSVTIQGTGTGQWAIMAEYP